MSSLSIILVSALFYLGVSQGAMPPATKTKYESYLKEFEGQRGQNPSDAQFQANKTRAILFMKSKFEAAGLTVHLQNFTSTDTNNGQAISGTNLIAVLPGPSYKTAQDEVVVLAANIDTYGLNAGGVNNDGTGLVGLLAIAEDLAGSQRCRLKNSIIFAAFDLSETGGGSTYCNRSCGSVEFLKNRATFIGSGKIQLAMVMECIWNFARHINSQDYPQSLQKNFNFVVLEAITRNMGDYLAVSGRSDDAAYMQDFERFYLANKVQNNFRFHKFQWDINGVPTAENRSTVISGFKNGDYMSFWDADINAILVTDTCYNRGYMRNCKDDKTCDTMSKISINPHGYEFMYSAVYSAMRVTKNLTCTAACASCSPHADCRSDVCVCKAGYTGDGITCTPIGCVSCSPHAECKNNFCVCKTGYTGDGNSCKKASSSLIFPHRLLVSSSVILSFFFILNNAFLYENW